MINVHVCHNVSGTLFGKPSLHVRGDPTKRYTESDAEVAVYGRQYLRPHKHRGMYASIDVQIHAANTCPPARLCDQSL